MRHTLVGVGEATFVTIAPTFVADLFPENKRGRIFGIFYLAIPCGTAAGYLLGGWLGPAHGWRFPFYIAAVPGFLLALRSLFSSGTAARPVRSQKETPERGTLRGLARNPAFWMVTLGMAAGTFSLGGIQVWMPTFLSRARGYSLEAANLIFGKIVVVDGILASLAGGWLGDKLLPRMKGSYYFVSAVSMGLGVPVMFFALFNKGPWMVPAIAVAAFLLLLNTSPLNTALVNSVGSHIRATAIAVNIFLFHLLGDVPSPTLMGYVADRHSLQAAFILPVIAMAVSSAILFYGMRFAPVVRTQDEPRRRRSLGGMSYFHWIAGCVLGLAWFWRLADAALGVPKIADISRPEWDRKPPGDPARQHYRSGLQRSRRHRSHAHSPAGSRIRQLRSHRGG